MPQPTRSATDRRIGMVAGACFASSGVAFLGAGLEAALNRAFFNSLVFSATATIGLLGLALGLLSLGWRNPSAVINVVVTTATPDSLMTHADKSEPTDVGSHAPASGQGSQPMRME